MPASNLLTRSCFDGRRWRFVINVFNREICSGGDCLYHWASGGGVVLVILVRIERSNRRVVPWVEFSAPWTTFSSFVVSVLVLAVARRPSAALEATTRKQGRKPECERKSNNPLCSSCHRIPYLRHNYYYSTSGGRLESGYRQANPGTPSQGQPSQLISPIQITR